MWSSSCKGGNHAGRQAGRHHYPSRHHCHTHHDHEHRYYEHAPLPSTRVVIPRPSVSNHHFVSFVCRRLTASGPRLPVDFAVAMAGVDDHLLNMLPLFLLILVTILSNFFDSVVPGATSNSDISGTICNQCATPSSYRMGIALGPPPTQSRLGGAPISSLIFNLW